MSGSGGSQGIATPAPYSYRADPAVPSFDDSHPVILFDGHCALCSGWVRFVLRQDRVAVFRLLPAQTPLGTALYRHYDLHREDYETNILIEDGRAYLKSESAIRMLERLGAPWSAARFGRLIPAALRAAPAGSAAQNARALSSERPATTSASRASGASNCARRPPKTP